MDEVGRQRTLAVLALSTLLAAIFLVVLPAQTASAATIQVTTTADENTDPGSGCSLREAILSAEGNGNVGGCVATALPYGDDTITFAAGTNGTAITLGSALPDITTNLQLQGNGAGVTIVDGNHAVRGFTVTGPGSPVVGFTGLTIRNGSAGVGVGGGILANFGTVTVIDSTLSGNSAASGGGIFVSVGSLTVTGSTLSDNTATGQATSSGGGIFMSLCLCSPPRSTSPTAPSPATRPSAAAAAASAAASPSMAAPRR